ncbi:MAG: diguanylate cyclase [Oscillospiraceae bacterium]|nr:diguanylate cyclase [Oscillospiraceae bacterium]
MDRHDTLLIACGTRESREQLRSILGESYNLLEAGNIRQGKLLLEQNRSCIAAMILDITAGVEVEEDLFRQRTDGQHVVPVIVITRDDDIPTLDRCFSLGAADVIPLDYDPYAMLHRIENIVQLHLHKENLEELVKEQAEILRHSNETMVDALSSIIEYRSVESGQHILRIRHFTRVLMEQVAANCPEFGLTEEAISIISSAAALHDVGKIGIPDAILTKPGKLTAEEWEAMKTHTHIGCQILESLGSMGNEEYLRYAHNICHYHHERWDGGGYPEGLKGNDIPICAQVVGLADVYDALTTKRVYKDAHDLQTAANMILNGECGTFSPRLLECFIQVLPKFEELCLAYADGLSPKTETFDVTLPKPAALEDGFALQIIHGKYQCLLHYINAFVLELSVDQGYYFLRYNPYPELGIVNRASNYEELVQIVLDEIVAPEDRQRMQTLIDTGIEEYLQAGLRRQAFRFRFRKKGGGVQPYDVTLLRANVNQTERRSLAVLCRKVSDTLPASQDDRQIQQPYNTKESTYCCRNDRDFTLVQVGDGVHDLAGYSPEDVFGAMGGRLIEIVHPDDRELVRTTFREQLNRGTNVQMEFRVIRKNGQVEWVLNKSRLVMGEDGEEYLYSHLTDISSSKQAYDLLAKRLERYEIILAQTENVLFDWNLQEDAIAFSDTWEKIFGFIPSDGSVWRMLEGASFLHPDDVPLLYDRIRTLQNGSDFEMLEVRIATAKGRYLWCRFRASAIRDEADTLIRIVGIIINIDAEKQAAQVLQERAERDALTKLLNKDAGRRQVEEYLAQFPQGVQCALLIIDLDNFKQVNDQYGHLFGDTVLTKAAKEIKKLFRAQDILARIGGDEFMILLRGVSDRGLVESRCERLLSVFRNAFRNGREKLPISCSVGIALSPEHGSTYVELFRRADQALYQAKAQGKDSYTFYSDQEAVYLAWNTRLTAVSNRIDSDDQPGLADSSLVQYAFQKLYASRDVDASINELLALIGRQTNVSRVYVFENSLDNKYCSNTYEWCNTGIAPEIGNLQDVSYETDIPDYEQNFDEHGIFCCTDIETLPRNLYDILAPQNIRSLLHCAIRDNGVFRGYVGFDECVNNRIWTMEQINLLTYFSEMLSVFLLKMRAQERTTRHAQDLHDVLDRQNAWIYIVDPDTQKLLYLNDRIRQYCPNANVGMNCHEALGQCGHICSDCPMKNLVANQGKSVLLTNPRYGGPVLAESAMIRWEGKPACMLTYRKLPELQA